MLPRRCPSSRDLARWPRRADSASKRHPDSSGALGRGRRRPRILLDPFEADVGQQPERSAQRTDGRSRRSPVMGRMASAATVIHLRLPGRWSAFNGADQGSTLDHAGRRSWLKPATPGRSLFRRAPTDLSEHGGPARDPERDTAPTHDSRTRRMRPWRILNCAA